MDFGDELEKESAQVIKAQQEIVKVVAIDLFSGTIQSTPVGNPSLWSSVPEPGYTGGQARANWFLSYNSPSNKTTDSKDKGSSTSTAIARQIQQGKYTGNYIITNNLPYIERLENGWSTQAPSGVAAPNVSRVNSQISRIERTVNKKYGVN